MKTVEALISCMVLLSFTSFLLLGAPYSDSSLERYRLAEDVWRMSYLSGCMNQAYSAGSLDAGSVWAIANATNPDDTESWKNMILDAGMSDLVGNDIEGCMGQVNSEITNLTGLRIDSNSPAVCDIYQVTTALYKEGDIAISKTVITNGIPNCVEISVGG